MRTDSDSMSARRGVEVVGVERDEPALGLRHDLLGDDEAVAVGSGVPCARAASAISVGELVAGPDLGDAARSG